MYTDPNILTDVSSERRLQTFFSTPLPNNSERSFSNSPAKLAEAGFVRVPNAVSDEVECRFCGVKYSDWSGESPLAVHRTLNPKCRFLNTPRSELSERGKNKNNLESLRKCLFPGLDNSSSIYNCVDVEYPFLPKQGGSEMLFESHRRLTFLHKDLISSHAEVYAEAGFAYSTTSKLVFCVFCNLELDFQPTSRSDLEDIHSEKSPLCPFVCSLDLGNISLDAEKTIREKASSHQNRIQNDKKMNYAIKHAQYEDESIRFGTYSTWPRLLAKAVSCSKMAQCGFYYTGFSDKVTCYACGVGLSDWSPDADPESQHAKASPSCVFLLQFKGKDFIDKAQNIQLIVEKDQETTISQNPDFEAATFTQDCSSSSSSSLAANTTPTLSASASTLGSPTLDQEAIKAALACNYTLEQITRACKNFFDNTFRYPNEKLLLGTLMAADEHQKRLCEKSQEILEKEAVYQKKEAQFLAKEAHLQAEKAAYQEQITARDRELRHTLFELKLRDLVKIELEQKFVDQLQQQKEVVQQQREQIELRDQVIEYKKIQIQDQAKHIQSLMAELKRRQVTTSDDEESTSSDLEASNSDFSSSSDEIPLANCKVCLVKQSQIMFLPCKHICCCDSCASRLRGKNCPICRERSFGFEKVYLI